MLTLLKIGRLPGDFIEGMACEGGCVGGPNAHQDQVTCRRSRERLLGEADDRGIHENLRNYDMNGFSMMTESQL